MKSRELVVLMDFHTIGEAEIYKALLESAGIRAVVSNDMLVGILPLVSPVLDIKLVVAAEDADRAREVLTAGFDKEEFERETKTGPRKRTVPKAGTQGRTGRKPAAGRTSDEGTAAKDSTQNKAASGREAAKKRTAVKEKE